MPIRTHSERYPMQATTPLKTSPLILPEAFVAALQARFGTQYSDNPSVLEQHGRDESPFATTPPNAVVFARATQDVQDAIRLCAQHRVPLIPYGVGSSVEGQILAIHGGLTLDLSQMNRILEIHTEDMTVTVQPGVTREQLNHELRDQGFFFPIDPGANATLGGMASTSASGTTAVRYGTMRENVLALQAVDASGELVHTGTRANKTSAGYDLTHLLVGSEGTLAVFTEITLRIHPLPEAIMAAICSFPDIEHAVRSVIEIIQAGIPIARSELIDAYTVQMVNQYSKIGLAEKPLLLLEFHGSPTGVQEQVELVQEIAGQHGGADFEWASTPEARTRLWTARHHAHFAGLAKHPGTRSVTTDICVPISRLAEAVTITVKKADHSGIPYYLVGHVGDGNFHMGYLVNPDDPKQLARAEALNHDLVHMALDMQGTCTGEHGIGLHKIDFLEHEAGPGSIAMMRAIKQALDPLNIMNPGKVLAGA